MANSTQLNEILKEAVSERSSWSSSMKKIAEKLDLREIVEQETRSNSSSRRKASKK